MLKMRAVITLLVLLLSMCGSQTRSTQTELHTESQSTGAAAAAAAVTTQLDVSAELRELRDMVVELRVTLRFTQDDLHKIEAENDAQDTEMTAVKQRLVASETKVEALEGVNSAQEADLTTMKTEVMNMKMELSASETEVEKLKMEHAAQEAELTAVKTRLVASETKVEALERVNSAQEAEMTTMKTEVINMKIEQAAQEAELTAVNTRVAATETEVVNLEKEITEKPKVAFSVGLTNSGYIEAGNTDLNLVFTRIITNVGQAYSSITGFFTAPVKGVYYFRFTVMDFLSSRSMTIRIVKNGEQVMRLYEYDTDGQHTYLSSGVTLQLEVGDVVNMQLPAGYRLYDTSNNHSTFSGFLLFPL